MISDSVEGCEHDQDSVDSSCRSLAGSCGRIMPYRRRLAGLCSEVKYGSDVKSRRLISLLCISWSFNWLRRRTTARHSTLSMTRQHVLCINLNVLINAVLNGEMDVGSCGRCSSLHVSAASWRRLPCQRRRSARTKSIDPPQIWP